MMTNSDAGAGTQSGGPVFMLGGVPFQSTTPAAAADTVVQMGLESRHSVRGIPIRLSNAYCLALASQDPAYLDLMANHGLTFPDGFPVAWVARHTGHPEAMQVRGPGLFEDVLERGAEEGLRHYLYGTTDETLEKLSERLHERIPSLQIVGMQTPAFAPVEELAAPEVVATIKQTRPDLVWVGLGTPKQDFVARLLAEQLGVPVLGVGAAFDYSAETLDVAPEALRRVGLEWAYRLYKEPKRLWRRYLFGNARFLTLAAKDYAQYRRGSR